MTRPSTPRAPSFLAHRTGAHPVWVRKPGSTDSINFVVARPNERPPKAVRDAFKALQIAVFEVMADHKRTGDPVYVWENGKVVRIPAHRIRTPSTDEPLERGA